MVLQSSGAISLSDIQTEFGGVNPIGINEYYAGGTYVLAGTVGYPGGVSTSIPSSGAISFSNFYGASALTVTFTPAGGSTSGSPVALSNTQVDTAATITVSCSTSATWIYARTSGTTGAANVANNTSSSSITFTLNIPPAGGVRTASWTLNGTAGSITQYWTISLSAENTGGTVVTL